MVPECFNSKIWKESQQPRDVSSRTKSPFERVNYFKVVEFSHNRKFCSKMKKVCHVHMEVKLSAGRQSSYAPTRTKFFVFWSKSNYFLSERSSPLGLAKIYISRSGDFPLIKLNCHFSAESCSERQCIADFLMRWLRKCSSLTSLFF